MQSTSWSMLNRLLSRNKKSIMNCTIYIFRNLKDCHALMMISAFEPKVVQTSARNTKVCMHGPNFRNLQGYIFRILQHFATKLCNFTNFRMLFLSVVMHFVLLA